MDVKTRALLLHWQSVNDDHSLRRARYQLKVLLCASSVLLFIVIVDIALGWSAIWITAPSAIFGFALGKAHSLRTHMDLWPLLRRYVNWQQITDDLQT
jgi:hypothetical protein